MRDIRPQKAGRWGGGWVSLGPVASSKEDCKERVCFWKI
jgi:hypothetical protein